MIRGLATLALMLAPLPVLAQAGLADVRARPATDEVIYFVLPDRFENGDPRNDRGGLTGDRLATGYDPSAKGFYHGGDLAGLTKRLDYIQSAHDLRSGAQRDTAFLALNPQGLVPALEIGDVAISAISLAEALAGAAPAQPIRPAAPRRSRHWRTRQPASDWPASPASGPPCRRRSPSASGRAHPEAPSSRSRRAGPPAPARVRPAGSIRQ